MDPQMDTQRRSISPSAQSAASTSCFSLSYLSVQIPKLDLRLPVNHRVVVVSHMTDNKTERSGASARHTTAKNGSYFVLRAMMLVSAVELWSMSGALTGSDESLSLTALTIWSDAGVRSSSCISLRALVRTVGIRRERLEK